MVVKTETSRNYWIMYPAINKLQYRLPEKKWKKKE